MGTNERGVSLIEVLAVIVISSLILVLTWNVFFQGTTYSNKSISKSVMQQEANTIILQLKKVHRTYSSYTVTAIDCGIQVEGVLKKVSQVEVFKNENLCIHITGIPPAQIISNETNLILFTLLITDKENLVDINKFVTPDNVKDLTRLVRIDSSLFKLTSGGN